MTRLRTHQRALGTAVAVLVTFAALPALADSAATVESGATTTTTFSYTGNSARFTVPPGVTSLQITATGAAGGAGQGSSSKPTGSPGGLGATVTATVPVTPGASYIVDVGGAGGAGGTLENGGFNGGDKGRQGGGGGGGASSMCPTYGLPDPRGNPAACVVIAAGGGAPGANGINSAGAGGNAGQAGVPSAEGAGFGGQPGQPGGSWGGGAGGTSPETGGTGEAGQLRRGGRGGFSPGVGGGGGGGGGGLYGGGGGGGAGYTEPELGSGKEAGGSGGGGSSLGASIAPNASGLLAQVVITYSTPSGEGGTGVLGTNESGPSTAQIEAALSSALVPSGRAGRIASVRMHARYQVTFNAPSGGEVVISWYELPRGAHLASTKPVLVGQGRASVAKAGAVKLTIKLTARGKSALKHARRLKLTAKGIFIPTGKSAVSVKKAFTLR